MEKFERILEIDDVLAREDQKLDKISSNSHKQRVLLGNFSSAEGHAYLEKDSSQIIRSLIARGSYSEVKEMISSENDSESIFEKARIECYDGNFNKALSNLNFILKEKNIHLLTKMTAHQMRSLCYYELNLIDKAISEIERVQALEYIYPRSEAAFFACCIYIRSLNVSGAKELAKKEIKKLFSNITSNSYCLSLYFQLTMYLRTKIFLAQNSQTQYAAMALAGYWLAEKLQSPLHQGLFILDLSKLQDNDLGKIASKELPYYSSRFKYIQLQKDKNRVPLRKISDLKDVSLLENSPNHILFLNESSLFDIKNSIFINIKLSELYTKILKYIAHRKVSAEELYNSVWGGNEYHPLENNSAIRTALKRLRKITGLEVEYKNDLICIPKVLIIL